MRRMKNSTLQWSFLCASVYDGEGEEEKEEMIWFNACRSVIFLSTLTTEFFYFQVQARALKAFFFFFFQSGAYKHEILFTFLIMNKYWKSLVYLQPQISLIAFKSMFTVWHLLPLQPQLCASMLLMEARSMKSNSLAVQLLESKWELGCRCEVLSLGEETEQGQPSL